MTAENPGSPGRPRPVFLASMRPRPMTAENPDPNPGRNPNPGRLQ